MSFKITGQEEAVRANIDTRENRLEMSYPNFPLEASEMAKITSA